MSSNYLSTPRSKPVEIIENRKPLILINYPDIHCNQSGSKDNTYTRCKSECQLKKVYEFLGLISWRSIILIIPVLFLLANCQVEPYHDNDLNQNKIAKKIVEITDTFKLPNVMVDYSQIYVWDKFLCKVCIYSKTDFKKVIEFGKKGEGPGEFRVIHSVYLDKNYIYVNSFPRLSFFSKDGKYIKEIKGITQAGDYQPIGKNYIGKKYIYTPPDNKKNKREYVLLDANLHKIKDLIGVEYLSDYIQVNPQKVEVLVFRDCTKGFVYKGKFYVGSTNRGFFLAVFDEEGNMLYEINRDYQQRKVTEELKGKIINRIKDLVEDWEKYSETRGYYFPDFLPAYISFAIDNDKIYVFTYPNRETPMFINVMIFNLQGELLGNKSSIPSLYLENLMMEKYYFFEGKVYFIEPRDRDWDKWGIMEYSVE